jgi:crotonobetainyl-CoA:carnitine CoA-transferase CaiB-like acyl-CoA transferase
VEESVVTRRALGELMNLAGRQPPDFVDFVEGFPALATRFRAEEAAAAALAASGVLAADLWRQHSGRPQRVTVVVREAAAALTSFLLNRFGDAARTPGLGREGRTPADGFFPTRDGRFIYLHPSFPESGRRLHALMGSPADREAAARAALTWTAPDLEAAIAEGGLCGAMVRTPEEWDESDQGRILRTRAPVEVTRLGDSPREPLAADAEAPLSGIRTLDLTRVLAGPTCARTLAQYGSEVLYVASPTLPTVEAFVADTNHGKRSAWLDLKSRGGRGTLERLVEGADVFSQGYRAGAMERLGFGPARLAALRPGIVCVEINAYGHEGPWRDRPGWEQLAQTVTGMAHVHGLTVPDAAPGPRLQPGAVNDYTTGFLAALGAMIALQRRALHGGSYLVRVSLAQTAMWVRGLGLAEPDRLLTVKPLTPEEIDAWRIDSATGYGPMRHLRPPVTLSATPTRWAQPVVKLGTHPPAWL